MTDRTAHDAPSLEQEERESNVKMMLISWAIIMVLVVVWSLVQPSTLESITESASQSILDTLRQAESRVTAHFSDGDFSILDNEVLRQVAFASQGKPVQPTEPLLVLGGSMMLGAVPIHDGHGFALIVDRAGKAECEEIIAAYADKPLLVNARPASHMQCEKFGNLIRIDVAPAPGE